MEYADIGQKKYEEFVKNRLLSDSQMSVWDPMKKLSLKTFTNLHKKKKTMAQNKVVKLKEERQFFASFLVLQKYRPELAPKLSVVIGEYELSYYPRTFFSSDGELLTPNNKSTFLSSIEDLMKANTSEVPDNVVGLKGRKKVIIIDAMGVVQGLKRQEGTNHIKDVIHLFLKRIKDMTKEYDEARVIFDRYLEKSLKNVTRRKRATATESYHIHPEMKLGMKIKDLLSSSETKRQLSILLANTLLDKFDVIQKPTMIVAFEDVIKQKNGFELKHNHEEADTLIPNQVLAASVGTTFPDVHVWSPDTDVFLLLLDILSNGSLHGISITMHTGNIKHRRLINMNGCLMSVGKKKCKGLVALHNFTGADWGGKFAGKTKETWIKAYLDLDENDPVVHAFGEFGKQSSTHDDDSILFKQLERFVCKV